MSKITLNTVGSLTDTTTAQITINQNNAIIQTAFDNTLSRDGTSPNTLTSTLDTNSQRIINLPAPVGNSEPLRLQDLVTFTGGGTISTIPAGGTTGQALKKLSNTNFDVGYGNVVSSVGLALPSDLTVTGSPVTGTGTLTGTWAITPQGSGAIVRATSPTITTPSISGALTVTSNSGTSIAVGPAGVSNPAFQVDSSSGSLAAGLRVVGAVSGGTVNVLTSDSGSNNNIAFNGKGTGTVTLGSVSTGGVNLNNLTTVTSASANSLTVGPNGSSNPVLGIDSSTASSVAGIKVTGAATGGTVTIQTTDTSANNNLLIDAKGSGSTLLGRTSTGGVNLGGSSNNAKLLFNGSTSGATTVIPLVAASGTLTLPSATDTLVGKATTDTLTNKTISASGTGNSINLNPIANSIGANVALNNTANYFDGPSVAQGTSGTWFASGTVTVADTGAGANILAKLWDGTTVIASGSITTSGVGINETISLSGFITSPAANLRISCRDTTANTGLILANASGNSKDSTITAFRIG